MEKMKLNAEMTFEEKEHIKWVKEQMNIVPDFFYSDVKIPAWKHTLTLDDILNQKKKVKA